MTTPAVPRERHPVSRRAAAVALAALVAVHAVIAWFPFRLDPPGYVPVEVRQLDTGALDLGGRRIVAEGPAPWDGVDLAGVEAVVVDLLVRPAAGTQFGPARILTNSRDYGDANLMIGQQRDNLVVRVRRPGSDAAGNPPLVVPRAFTGGRWARIQVVADREGILAEVEGVGAREVAVDGPPMPGWDPAYPVSLGDERLGDRVWHGEVAVAVVSADGLALDYLAPGTLRVPERAWYVPGRLREALTVPGPRSHLRSGLHLLAFVPFGALVVPLRRRDQRRPVAGAAAAAAAVAVVLQLGKVVFEHRHPSLLTVLTQATGALVGAGLVVWWGRRRGRPRPGPQGEPTGQGFA